MVNNGMVLEKQKSALNMRYLHSTSLMNQTYSIKFEVDYPTVPGESIGVIGSTEELGKWKQAKYHLHWTSGHKWVSRKAFVTQKSYFQFKYVLLKDMELVHWERGIDRIADLEILTDNHRGGGFSNGSGASAFSGAGFQNGLDNSYYGGDKTKNIEFKDVWEQFSVNFSINLPADDM